MAGRLVAVVQGMVVIGVGALLGWAVAGGLGAAVGAVVSAPFGVGYGRAVALGLPYSDGRRGARRCLIDATWSAPNTWAGAVYYGLHRLRRNSLDPDRCRGTGSLWLVDGIVPQYATTIGIVKAGSNDRRDRHELVHVLQARLLGPLYLPLVLLNYPVATVVPYWLLVRPPRRRPVTGLRSYFERGVYPHTWHEYWAYRVGGHPPG
jgi:hypothetical protein